MNCSEALSNVIHGTKKSATSKMGFFATRVFSVLSEFSFTEHSQNMGQHGKGNTMCNSSLALPTSSLVFRH